MPYQKPILCALLLLLVAPARATAEDAFQQQVMPFLTTYCVKCHNQERSEAELNLTRYTSAAALGEHFRQWETVVTFLKKGEMPPAKAKQPSADERGAVLETIEKLLADEAKKLAGDPGIVLPRRLNSTEYN